MRGPFLTGVLVLSCAFALATGVSPAGNAAAQQAPASVTPEHNGEVIVRFRDGAGLPQVARALDDAESTVLEATTIPGVAVVLPDSGQTVEQTVAALEGDPDVDYAEPNYTVRIAATPNDPQYASNQWHYPYIGLPAAWDTSTGSSSIIVAVVDTGVELTDAELDSKITTGINAGYDFVNNDASAADDHGHGTHVAGTVAAETNNGTGVAGVCWACKIMPVKVMDSAGTGNTDDVAAGIDWARTHGAQVVNLSLGSLSPSITLENAVNAAWSAGVVVVAAAGNYADNLDGLGQPYTADDGVMYPAAYPNAIGVGAFDASGNRSSFSNYGPELDVSAPGASIYSTIMGAGYQGWSGTSMATPHVAGVVGLMMSAGITDPATIRTRLISTATDAGTAGFDNYYGYGRINAAAAVGPEYGVLWGSDSTPTSMVAGAQGTASISFTNTGSLDWNPSGGTLVRLSYHWRPGACPNGNAWSWDGLRTALPATVATGETVTDLSVAVRAPASTGNHCLVYDLVHEGVTWFSRAGANTLSRTVNISAAPLYAVTWGSHVTPSTMETGELATIAVSFTNAGSMTWQAAGSTSVRLSYHWRPGACPGSGAWTWDGLRSGLSGNVAPGGAVNALQGSVRAPAVAGAYCLVYDLVHEGVTWFSRQGAATKSTTVTVTQPVYGVSWGVHNTPSTMPAGADVPVTMSFTNTGSLTWVPAGGNPVRLSYHWRSGACPNGNPWTWDGLRTILPQDVASQTSVTGLSATVRAPNVPGTYCLSYDLVREGITWFSRQGAETLSVTVTVT